MHPLSTSDVIAKEHSLGVIVFQHVFEHAPVYRALLSERGAAVVVTLLRTDIAALVHEMVIDQFVAVATVPLPADMQAEYCGAALWSLVNWWLRNGFSPASGRHGVSALAARQSGIGENTGAPNGTRG